MSSESYSPFGAKTIPNSTYFVAIQPKGFNPVSAYLLPNSSCSLNRARYRARARARIPSSSSKGEAEWLM
jgi:hypothetical protein